MSTKTPQLPKDRAEQAIRARLATMQPGERLPTGQELAQNLSINIGVMRQALRRIEKAGELERRYEDGTAGSGYGRLHKP